MSFGFVFRSFIIAIIILLLLLLLIASIAINIFAVAIVTVKDSVAQM